MVSSICIGPMELEVPSHRCGEEGILRPASLQGSWRQLARLFCLEGSTGLPSTEWGHGAAGPYSLGLCAVDLDVGQGKLLRQRHGRNVPQDPQARTRLAHHLPEPDRSRERNRRYIDGFYNPVRRHSALDFTNPLQFEGGQRKIENALHKCPASPVLNFLELDFVISESERRFTSIARS
jgi:hypothetical protein